MSEGWLGYARRENWEDDRDREEVHGDWREGRQVAIDNCRHSRIQRRRRRHTLVGLRPTCENGKYDNQTAWVKSARRSDAKVVDAIVSEHCVVSSQSWLYPVMLSSGLGLGLAQWSCLRETRMTDDLQSLLVFLTCNKDFLYSVAVQHVNYVTLTLLTD